MIANNNHVLDQYNSAATITKLGRNNYIFFVLRGILTGSYAPVRNFAFTKLPRL